MSRLFVALAAIMLINGCAHFRQQAADCSSTSPALDAQSCDGQVCDGEADDEAKCDDCLPPHVAGKYFYHKHIDHYLTVSTAQKCARRDLKALDDCEDLSRDFRDGYLQAYIDLALARPACVPAVPPKKYWHAWHRSCAGRDDVDQWFAGYRSGLDNGLNSGVSRFNHIVGNPENCCISAGYVSPFASSPPRMPPTPPGSQTISEMPGGNTVPILVQRAPLPVPLPAPIEPSEITEAAHTADATVRQ